MYTFAHDIVERRGLADELIMDCEEFASGHDRLPYKPLAVYYSVSIHRGEGCTLEGCLAKLQDHLNYNIQRAASMDSIKAKRMLERCNTLDLASVVATICQLDLDQLNCLGY